MQDEPQLTSAAPDNVTFRMLLGLVSFALAGFIAFYAQKALLKGPGKVVFPFTAAGEGWVIHGRQRTGLQRADHAEFFDGGNRLAMSCPRYSVLTIWETPNDLPPVNRKNVDLQGRPVGLTALGDKIVVLQRPPGDDRHIKPGFYEVFDRDGTRVGEPVEVGWEPDQLEFVERDGKTYALILFSGSAEGESNRGAPSLTVAAFDQEKLSFEKLSQVDFETDGEDPLHFVPVVETADGGTKARVLVTFGRKPGAAWVDWTDPAAPVRTVRHPWPDWAGDPARDFVDRTNRRVLSVPTETNQFAVSFPFDGSAPSQIWIPKPASKPASDPNAPDERFLAIDQEKGTIGRYGTRQGAYFMMPLKGPYGFGSVRLTDLAVFESADGDLLKVAAIDRSGGLHWIACHAPVRPKDGK